MSTQITTAFVQQYSSNVMMLVEQEGSRLRRFVDVETGIEGKSAYFDQAGSITAKTKANRHDEVVYNNTPHARRKLDLNDKYAADLIDREDLVRTLIDPSNPYAMKIASALGREMDQQIIDAALGTAYTGESGGTSVTLPSSQVVEEDYVESGSASDSDLTLGKIRRAKAIMDANEVPDNGRVLVHTAAQAQALLADDTYTSSDYNTIRALVNGDLNTFLGFTFVRTELLSIASNIRSCFAFQMDGLKLGIGRDMSFTVDRLPHRHNAVQVYGSMTIGATRMEEERVVEIQCDEAA